MTRTRGVRVPIISVPIVILVLLPALLVGGAELLRDSAIPVGAEAPFEQFGPEMQAELTGETGPGQWAAFVLEFLLAPLYLLVPLIVATVIAADSFAGERERGTLEALLHTGTSDEELFVAKLLAAWIPAVVVGLAGFAVYAVIANLLGWPTIGRIFFPTPVWLALAFWVAPAVAALGLGVTVLVSSRVGSLQAAHQIGSLVVLPVIVLVIAQITGAVFLSLEFVFLTGSGLLVLDALLIGIARRTFDRNRLAERL